MINFGNPSEAKKALRLDLIYLLNMIGQACERCTLRDVLINTLIFET